MGIGWRRKILEPPLTTPGTQETIVSCENTKQPDFSIQGPSSYFGEIHITEEGGYAVLSMLKTLLLTVAQCYSKATVCECFDSRLSLLFLVQAKKRDPNIEFESEHTLK